MTGPVRVLIADDHAHAREGMRDIVGMLPGFEVAGEARSGEEAVALADRLKPDIILMDIRMPGMDGLEATRRIKERHPEIKIVIVTVSDDAAHLFEALKKGAQGYLLKNLNPGEWLAYLQAVASDETPMSRELALRLLKEFTRNDRPAGGKSPLTGREREVLEWAARGASNREIAEKLHISENTVKNHLKSILHKLHLQNRVQLARYAAEQGWLRD